MYVITHSLYDPCHRDGWCLATLWRGKSSTAALDFGTVARDMC
jgi:hypothetical protein